MNWNFNQKIATERLVRFFKTSGAAAQDFGQRVYQTFEATTYAQVVKWYKDNGWTVAIVNPGRGAKSDFRLKFNTRGNIKNFTYVICYRKNTPQDKVQIRHQVRVATFYNRKTRNSLRANIVCDVAVLKHDNYDRIVGNMHVDNDALITFAEAKHMDAYAELIAAFIGLVHEMQPWRIRNDRRKRALTAAHPKPFLNLSGVCMGTAEGVKATMTRRKMDVDVHDAQNPFLKI